MKNKKVSIITPSYNSKKFIKDTIESVKLQTYKNWEMIIVDDCSTDDSVNYIKALIKNENRVKLIALNKNVGAAEARNKALEIAQGEYIAFLDSDDIWMNNKLEKQLKFMEDNGYSFTFTAYQPFSEDGLENYKIINVPTELDYVQYCKNTIIGCLTVVINKNEVGDFRMPNIRSSHDMALWLLIMKRGFKAYGLNENLAKYRLVGSSNTANKTKAAKDVWRVYRKIENIPYYKSIWYFLNYANNAIKKRKQ